MSAATSGPSPVLNLQPTAPAIGTAAAPTSLAGDGFGGFMAALCGVAEQAPGDAPLRPADSGVPPTRYALDVVATPSDAGPAPWSAPVAKAGAADGLGTTTDDPHALVAQSVGLDAAEPDAASAAPGVELHKDDAYEAVGSLAPNVAIVVPAAVIALPGVVSSDIGGGSVSAQPASSLFPTATPDSAEIVGAEASAVEGDAASTAASVVREAFANAPRIGVGSLASTTNQESPPRPTAPATPAIDAAPTPPASGAAPAPRPNAGAEEGAGQAASATTRSTGSVAATQAVPAAIVGTVLGVGAEPPESPPFAGESDAPSRAAPKAASIVDPNAAQADRPSASAPLPPTAPEAGSAESSGLSAPPDARPTSAEPGDASAAEPQAADSGLEAKPAADKPATSAAPASRLIGDAAQTTTETGVAPGSVADDGQPPASLPSKTQHPAQPDADAPTPAVVAKTDPATIANGLAAPTGPAAAPPSEASFDASADDEGHPSDDPKAKRKAAVAAKPADAPQSGAAAKDAPASAEQTAASRAVLDGPSDAGDAIRVDLGSAGAERTIRLTQAAPPAVQPHVAAQATAAVAAAVVANAGARRTRFDVRLEPTELGRVDVRLDIGHDGRVATRLIVDRPETLEALRHDARELQRNLEQAGFQLGQGGLAFQLRDGRADLWRETAPSSAGSSPAAAAAEPEPAPAYRPAARSGGVDITV